MSGLSDWVNLTIALVVVFGIGYLIFKIDRRVKREGSLFKRDSASVDEIDLPINVEGKKFGIRVLAYILDFIVIYGFNTAAGYSFGFIFFTGLSLILAVWGKEFSLSGSEYGVLNWVLGILLNIVYFATYEWVYNGSFGKLILGMRVVNLDGQKCNLRQATIRAVYRIIDGLVFGLVAYAKMKAPLYQRHGDIKAKTIVISSKDPFITQKPEWWYFLLATVVYFILAGLIQIVWVLPELRIL